MKNDEKEEITNLVWTDLKTVAHSSHNWRLKNVPKEVKIQGPEENGKNEILI
jgi:hypothetical protein